MDKSECVIHTVLGKPIRIRGAVIFWLARVDRLAYDFANGAKCFGERFGTLLLRADDGILSGWLLPHGAGGFGGPYRLRGDDEGVFEILVRAGQ